MEKAEFRAGFKAMLPITTGIIPFGAVTGTTCSELGLKFYEAITMNVIVYAGASQLAAMDLMRKHAAVLVVVLTALAINMRFLLYSAAMASALAKAKPWQKFLCAHTLTDQSYAVMMANIDKLDTPEKEVWFYFGTAACMMLVWHSSFIAGFVFGNFAPANWALDFAVPLSFLALLVPAVKNRLYFYVAAYSATAAVIFYGLPYRSGLIVTAVTGVAFGAFLTRKKAVA